MISLSLIIILLTSVTTYIGVKFIIPFAIKINFVDNPNNRKVHKKPLPMLAGAVFTVVTLIGILILSWLNYLTSSLTTALFLAVVMLSTIGFIDDYYKTKSKEFSPLPRLLVQIIASFLIVQFGDYVSQIDIPVLGYMELSPVLGKLFTMVWIIFIINVINFMDGLDGLAGGMAGIFAFTFLITSILMNQPVSALLSALMLGVAIGYLPHNFFPAKIIMGDTGSTLFGFMIGAISIIGAMKTITVITINIPLLILAIPIFDTLFVFLKRIQQGRSIFHADKLHLHHRLLSYGLSQVQAVMIIYLLCITTSASAIFILMSIHF
ncbi:glycosyltransferase family 4 protein [Rossellomorea sp. KS-H15a]|uniref:glycosyltransferase family 4 protein n=1 Tax=Rossellomorea sp. KS-H15a TaxID=2963940 RepID=UPI0020C6FEA9|nr:MraY family glycosyltransferase [Rossellomorea sp. KS-H15a]UTE77441.1 undecaprenyl/decaprenyl-phosphate alpha-N-acetylglucosaminyl 1-phosphate transferase [Rossellomorea sp. KS-H15a]